MKDSCRIWQGARRSAAWAAHLELLAHQYDFAENAPEVFLVDFFIAESVWVPLLGGVEVSNGGERQVAEIRPGLLIVTGRPEGDAKDTQIAYSTDDGLTWNASAAHADLPSPVDGCECSIVTHPNGKLYSCGPGSKLQAAAYQAGGQGLGRRRRFVSTAPHGVAQEGGARTPRSALKRMHLLTLTYTTATQ